MLCLHSADLNTDSVSILTPEREDYVGTFVKNLVIYCVSLKSHRVFDGLRMLAFGISLLQ